MILMTKLTNDGYNLFTWATWPLVDQFSDQISVTGHIIILHAREGIPSIKIYYSWRLLMSPKSIKKNNKTERTFSPKPPEKTFWMQTWATANKQLSKKSEKAKQQLRSSIWQTFGKYLASIRQVFGKYLARICVLAAKQSGRAEREQNARKMLEMLEIC